jgi:hypothetical protein
MMVGQLSQAINVFYEEEVIVSGGMVHLREDGMYLCPPGIADASESYEHEHCWKTRLHRRDAYIYISIAESCFYIFCMLLPVMGVSLVFLCGRTKIAANRVFFFFWLPTLLPSFSLLMCLSYINVARIQACFVRGELRVYWTLIRLSTLCRYENDDMEAIEAKYVKEEPHVGTTLTLRLLLFVPYAILFACAFQQLLVRMSEVAFVVMIDFRSFSLYQWLHLFGFINQIVGMMSIGLIEKLRLLLFMFGGHDTTWQWKETFFVSAYQSLVADAIVEQLQNRMTCLAAMWTFDSAPMQALLIVDEQDYLSKGTVLFEQDSLEVQAR